MKSRTCVIRLWIANDSGFARCYSLKPLRGDELGDAFAGFRLTNRTNDPSPVYRVRLLTGNMVDCDCPQHAKASKCKHADALIAAGLLPCKLLGLLEERTKLLDLAEAKLAEVSARAVQLQTGLAAIPPARPARRRAAKPAAA